MNLLTKDELINWRWID